MTSAYEPDPPAPIPLKWLILVGALVLGAVTLGPELGTFLPRSPGEEAVALAVQRTIVASQSAAIAQFSGTTGAITAEQAAALRAHVRDVADELLTGAYHDSWIESMDGVIDRIGADGAIFSGGADGFSRWHIVIHGDEATVNVRARIFLEMAQTLAGPRTTASNVVDYDLRLSRVAGTWRVGVLNVQFAPGDGP